MFPWNVFLYYYYDIINLEINILILKSNATLKITDGSQKIYPWAMG
jgi:hypothetical protein